VKYLAATAAAIALLALAAGCGGGGGSSSSTAPGASSGSTNTSASGDEASAQANEACAAANEAIAKLPTPENDVAVLEYLEQTEAAVTKLQTEVAAVGGSAGIQEYAAALAKSVAVLNEMTNAARSRNPDAVRELSKELVALHLGKVAQAAGLDMCAETPGVES
jgi:ABC-type glycerol-3-phosphate transport system substrate-binding protein